MSTMKKPILERNTVDISMIKELKTQTISNNFFIFSELYSHKTKTLTSNEFLGQKLII
jgi:hypothetical protein